MLAEYGMDATGKTLARLESGETTAGVFRVLWKWIEHYGIPLALYVDLKTVYVAPSQAGWSFVESACQKLGIRIIKAYSPQAKGRVERKHAVYQDRFTKELRLKGVQTVEEANRLLEGGFIEHLNQKFEKPARHGESAHKSAVGLNLNHIFCWEYERQVQQDWTFSFEGQYYQIEKQYGDLVHPKATICIRRHLDDTLSMHYQDKPLLAKKISEKPVKPCAEKKVGLSRSARGKLGKQKSPWKKYIAHDCLSLSI